MPANLPVAFAAMLAGGILLEHGIGASKAAFAGGGTSSAAAGSATTPGAIVNSAQLGPTTNPVPGATPNRLDQGMDFNNASKVVAPFNGTVVVSNQTDPGWGGGGYIAIRSTQDPSRVFYAAENWAPVVAVGQAVKVGEEIAVAHSYGAYGNPAGSGEIGWADPNSPTSPLARFVSNPAGMVLAFASWLRSLGVGAPSSTSNAGYA